MELFDDSDTEGEVIDISIKYIQELCLQLFSKLVKFKTLAKYENQKFLVLLLNDSCNEAVEQLKSKLHALKCIFTTTVSYSEFFSMEKTSVYDAVVDINYSSNCLLQQSIKPAYPHLFTKISEHLTPRGVLYIASNIFNHDVPGLEEIFETYAWNISDLLKTSFNAPYQNVSIISIQTRAIVCNSTAATYWGGMEKKSYVDLDNSETRELSEDSEDEDDIAVHGSMKDEQSLLDQITITRHVYEYTSIIARNNDNSSDFVCTCDSTSHSELSPQDITRAVNILKSHGVCIIRNLFPSEVGALYFLRSVILYS